jgi:transcriptional regulator with XRE-family HTH domain
VSTQVSGAQRIGTLRGTFRADSPVTINDDACSPSSEDFEVMEHPCSVPFDRSNDPGKPGPQFLVRAQSMRPVTGRPEAAEQALIAGGVGALLQQLRGERRMSLRDLEGRSGVTRSTISRVERGLRRPRLSMLGWLAWGLDAENVVPLARQLAVAAGDSMIAESRWSERMHARHAIDALYRGTMPVPFILLAPRAVDALGGVLPGDLDRLRQAQAIAHKMPWPPGMQGSAEALAVLGAVMGMSRPKLAAVGRTAVRVNDYQELQAQRARERARRAAEREEFRRKGRYAAGRRMSAGILR